MKALVKVALGKGNLELREVPDPVAGQGEVVMRVAATGVCGTDLHVEDDEYIVVPPVTIGHETSGRIVDIGPGVNGVAMALPDNVPDEPAALTEPLACCTRAVLEVARLGEVVPRHDAPVVVSGPGPIGILCAQVARASGHRVIILGTSADAARFAIARNLGFQELVDVTTTDPVATINGITAGRGVPVVIEAAGAAPSLATAIELASRGGSVVQIGLYGKSVPVPVDRLVIREVTLQGSFASTPSSWQSALNLMATGAVDLAPLISQILPLEEWATGFAAARTKVAGKIVLIPGS